MKNSARTGKTLQHIVLAVMLVFGLAFSFTYAKAEESASGIAASSSSEQTQTENSKDAATAGTTTTDQSAETSEEAAESSETATTESSEDTSSSAVASAKPSLATTLAAASGTSYNIYWYALIPGHDADGSGNANASWYGLGVGTVSGTNVKDPRSLSIGRVDLSDATFSPVTPPDITYNGVTYRYAAPDSVNANAEGYYTLVDMRYVVADGANAGNNGYNQPTVASGSNTYHFDHTLVLNSSDNYASVTFAVDYPDDTQGFVTDENWSKRVRKNSALSSITRPSYGTPTDFTETKTVNGVTYEFDGWYTDSACTQKADFTTGTVTGNMTFYGHYVAKTGNLTVSKTVAGNAANVNEKFNFTLTCTALAGKTYDGVEFGSDGVASFKLKNGESKTINGLPAGSQVDIQETGLSGNAKTSTTVSVDGTVATVKEESSPATSTVPKTVTIPNDGNTTTVAFTNTANAVSDTGISINTTPMAALAAFAAAGGIALAAAGMRKRNGERKER